MESNVPNVLKHYKDFDKLKSFGEYGNGHINDTYLLEYEGNNKIILQKVNKNISDMTDAELDSIVLSD